MSKDAGDEYVFSVLDDTSVNAFALPDGYIFINRGLIAYMRSEDELAGVIGHEIGHVVGAHAKRANLLSRMGSVAGIVGSVLTGTGQIADLSNAATATLTSGYRRDLELEADEYGGEFLARAGYNPLAMIDVIHVLKDQSLYAKNVLGQPAVYHGLFSTHPKNDKRLHEAVEKSLHLYPEELAEPERDIWEMMDGLVYGTASGGGTIKDSTYYHADLRVVVRFPDNWDVSSTSSIISGTVPNARNTFINVRRQNPPTTEQTAGRIRDGNPQARRRGRRGRAADQRLRRVHGPDRGRRSARRRAAHRRRLQGRRRLSLPRRAGRHRGTRSPSSVPGKRP